MMDNNIKIDEIVKQVLAETHTAKNSGNSTEVCKKIIPIENDINRIPVLTGTEHGRTAVLTDPEFYEMKDYPLPKIGAQEVLVKMEGCMIEPSDVKEFLKEKRVGQAALVGQEGTGTIVKLGSATMKDARGNVLKVGDHVVAVKKSKGFALSYRGNAMNAGVCANGWFSNYVVLQAGNQIYQVNELDQESRVLMGTAIAVRNAVERTIKLNKLDETKGVLVIGCGVEGLITMAVLKCQGISNIIAMDGCENALKRARGFGAKEIVNYRDKNGISGVQEKVKNALGGQFADVVFHCTNSSYGKSAAKRFLKKGSSVCEMGYILGRGKISTKYYEDSMPSGGRFYSSKDYEDTIAFLKKAIEMNIPMYQLITHRYHLEQINEAHWAALREDGLMVAVFNR